MDILVNGVKKELELIDPETNLDIANDYISELEIVDEDQYVWWLDYMKNEQINIDKIYDIRKSLDDSKAILDEFEIELNSIFDNDYETCQKNATDLIAAWS